MNYPLDQTTFNETIGNLVSHANMQTVLIDKLVQLLGSAMDASEHDDDDWYRESTLLFKDLEKIKKEHETRRWNEMNYQNQSKAGAYKAPPMPIMIPASVGAKVVKHLAEQPGKVERIEDQGNIVGLAGLQFNESLNMKANEIEKGFGQEVSEEELERMFSQKRTKVKKVQPKGLSDMTMEEIQELERKQDNSTDIYKIAARVKNLARGGNASLTEQGDMLCNTYCHVMKAFYDFADKIQDKNIKVQLTALIREQEHMPGTLIQAAGAGVKKKK